MATNDNEGQTMIYTFQVLRLSSNHPLHAPLCTTLRAPIYFLIGQGSPHHSIRLLGCSCSFTYNPDFLHHRLKKVSVQPVLHEIANSSNYCVPSLQKSNIILDISLKNVLLPPASEGWGKVIVPIYSSVHTGGGGAGGSRLCTVILPTTGPRSVRGGGGGYLSD